MAEIFLMNHEGSALEFIKIEHKTRKVPDFKANYLSKISVQ